MFFIAHFKTLISPPATKTSLGSSVRLSPTALLSCFVPSCPFENLSLDAVQSHVQDKHNHGNSITTEVSYFPVTTDIIVDNDSGQASDINSGISACGSGGGDTDADIVVDNDSGQVSDINSGISAGGSVGGEEDSAFDVPGPAPQPSRGRQFVYHHFRPTPYTRSSSESSSRHPSLSRRSSDSSLTPGLAALQIPSRTHSPTFLAPSPLSQVAFSHPNSRSSSQSSSSSSSSSEESHHMNVDLPDNISAEDAILNMASLRAIPLSHLQDQSLVACTNCQIGLSSQTALSHAKTTHKIKLSKEEKKSIQEVLNKPSMIKKPGDTPPPKHPCPPIKGILYYQGLKCDLCSYCAIMQGTINNHLTTMHRGAKGTAKLKTKSVMVQALSSQRPTYFQVVPVLSEMSQDNLFSVYLEQCVPHIDSLQLINPPVDHNEIPPLLKLTGWHDHLAPYTGDTEKVMQLLELTQPPHDESWIGATLRSTIEGYMKDVARKANHSMLGIRCLLMECPMSVSFVAFLMMDILLTQLLSSPSPSLRITQNGDHWIPLSDQTIETYARLFHQWTYAVLVTIEGHESGYKFPLTVEDKQHASELKAALISEPDKLHIDLFHIFIKPLVYPKDHGLVPGSYSKFNEPFECFYALSCLRDDGNFQPAELVTQKFAKMKYFIRGTVLYQALKVSDGDHYA